MTEWYRIEGKEAAEELGVEPGKGLSGAEASERLEKYGPNELEEKKKKSPLKMFFEQFKDFMIIVLIAAAVVSGLIGEASDTIAIIVIVVLNAIIGFVQEYRAEKAMEALKKMTAPEASVLRDGSLNEIKAREIVPGDVVHLEAGDMVPADLRLLEAAQLKVDEATLTGESVAVEKTTRIPEGESLPVGDRTNMAYKGTMVTYGRGRGVAVATAMKTELGKIATMLQEGEEVKTPLQKRLASFGKKLSVAVFVICIIVFVLGLLRGEPPLLMLLTAISLAVAAIPEALPAVVTISLALGAKKLVRQNALIRKLPAVETLGSVTYICSDKTGTLTLNSMTVQELQIGSSRQSAEDIKAENHRDLFRALALSNDAEVGSSGEPVGDPTELALYQIARDRGFDKTDIEEKYPRVSELPFDSERKCMTTIHEDPEGGYVAFTKGAPDVLLEKSATFLDPEGSEQDLEEEDFRKGNEEMAGGGLRVLGLAMRRWESLPEDQTPENIETGLTLLGLAGMMDPPREEARESVATCLGAGIKPVMITGDHPATATAIARKLGMVDEDQDAVLTGRELEKLPLEEFEERVEHIRVYARVAPEQKLKIVKGLQDRGQFVGMTGDGVNDAPALKSADIGIAMGITGTDVSKEASDMILRDDNFATIVKAIREGRRIFDNIRKFIKYTMTSNSGEIWTILLAPFLGLPVPLLPIHILWINLATDGLPGLALAAEPGERDLMERPPRHPRESIFAHGLGYHMIWVGLLMGFVSLFTQWQFIERTETHWQTMVFSVLCLSQLGHSLAIRSEKESLFTIGLFSNKYLLGAVTLTLVFQLAIIYVPFLNPIFKTAPLTLRELVIVLLLSTIVFIAVEIEKFVKRRLS